MPMQKYTGGELMCNGYLVRGSGEEYVAVDAPEGFAAWVKKTLPAGAVVSRLLLTHQHFDHIQDAALLREATGCRITACMPFTPAITLADHALQWGLRPPAAFAVDDVLGAHDSEATWAGLRWRALHLPGHSPDSMAYYLPEACLAFVGDALFAGSIGRTDLPGGSMSQLVGNIRSKLMTLAPDVEIYPGHGPFTSVGEEALNNPFIQR